MQVSSTGARGEFQGQGATQTLWCKVLTTCNSGTNTSSRASSNLRKSNPAESWSKLRDYNIRSDQSNET